MQDKKMYLFFAVFIVIFILTFGFVLFGDNIRLFTRASQNVVSLNKSLMIASSLETTVKDVKGVTITVFARNEEGFALANKKVQISTNLGSFISSEETTDNYGKVVFVLNSQFPGEASIKTTIDSKLLPYELKIKFSL